MRVLTLLVLFGSGALFQAQAKALFYDPGDLPPRSGAQTSTVQGLRPVNAVSPFPPRGHVGIHYWLEASDGTRMAEDRAMSAGGRFTLHIRSNTGGYLTVWSKVSGTQLTPMQGRWTGYELDGGQEYVVPGDFRPARIPSEGLVVLFARSQTEQVGSAADALAKLQRIARMVDAAGRPQLIKETDETTIGQIGTYVVHTDGAQPAAEIPIVP
jgi:hypothetical protein